ncbi:MAG: TonB-dependent receptor, partial [Gemmatimonadetes bacterium]|nr:TonB-dependent receptor [Gemmatimonadota bacterium]
MRPIVLAVLPPLLALLTLGGAAPLAAQETPGAVEGRVRDEEGAAVYSAAVTLLDGERVLARAETDRLGWYRLDGVPAGLFDLRVARIGHAEVVLGDVTVRPGGTTVVDVTLPRAALAIAGVRVEAERSRDRERFEDLAGVTARELSLEDLKRVPGVAEADPLRAVEVLPGVVSTSDFSSAFHVRGGSADQNLILLDGVPVFSPFHLGGFFGVFNADMVRRAELRSGGFQAEHGGRVSSVLIVESDPGQGIFSVDAGVSLLAARVAVAGGARDVEALGLRTVRARASVRRSYFDVLLKPVFDFPYHLTDLQGVVEAWTEGGDRIRVTAYSGDDVLDLGALDEEDFPLRVDWTWGNDLVGAAWTRPRPGGGALDVSAGATRYGTRLLFPDFADTEFRSRIGQAYMHADLDARPFPAWRTRTGLAIERFEYHNRAASGGTEFGRGDGAGVLTG